ncbi:MAG TPA: UDP-N-acetylmuramoyl-L-alanine--D-glutamate ligase [Rhodocyclaceae bacterium]|jgi:UDP-N-acetylmuramoylalanine--D-glutamate ligase|nr:UDP-N-acetylmuramoyl-L-alanine--D-glutamate ligase [Rhodocyclaceae bacterium]
MKLADAHVLVLGLGESGLAMARWCARMGARVRVADTRAVPPYLDALRGFVPEAEFIAGEFKESLLHGIDMLALSPGLPAGQMIVLQARLSAIAVVGEIELFADALRVVHSVADMPRIIAITGTNGKTTTTALTGHLCRSAGYDTEIAGNISPAALAALLERIERDALPRIWVLELSSFQLETLKSLNADAATVLNVSDDHLDRYISLDEYAEAKARIFGSGEDCVQHSGTQVLNRDDVRVRRMAVNGRELFTFGLDIPAHEHDFGLLYKNGEHWLAQGDHALLAVSRLPIKGLHNAANALAALALCSALRLPMNKLVNGLLSFKGLPHRVEFVAEVDGVTYYDDSKGTNVGATLAALDGKLAERVVLIAGGDGKGQDFSPLRDAVQRAARAVVLLGRDADQIDAAIQGTGVPIQRANDLPSAVHMAASLAEPGDAVLLSPACASFDMFRNYAHRAEVFVAAVHALPGVKS